MGHNDQTSQHCQKFRHAWESGNRPLLEEFLRKTVQVEITADSLLELILTEFQFRQEASETPEVAEYLRRFPELQERLQRLLPLMTEGGESMTSDSKKHEPSAFEATHIGPVAADGDSQRQTRDAEDLLKKSPTIGPYKLLQQIGQGGMGSVFMAEQGKPVRRRVALKLIKLGMDSRDVITRFEAERQALAMMDHQNIAKVLDAGTTSDGRPYFVMELVNGIPITDYCDKFKLALNDRLGLFSQACKAIQHAHQKGIIHRDIKPSNVLVTQHDGVPVVKVIDFGLAKALQSGTRLTDKTMFTEFGQVVGTLQYMSPEQAELNALDVDTRSDVYSLGVLLYELLTGSTPIEKQTLKEMALDRVLAAIREQEPPRPSFRLSSAGTNATGISEQRRTDPRRLSLILKGDLDWIAMKALEKDRTRRYDSPAQLAEDVQRYLNSEAIIARPPSVSYRLRKTLRKHRVAVGTGAIVLASLIAGIFGTAVMWRQAVNANATAESEKNKAIAFAAQRDEETRKAQKAAEEADVATKQAQRAAFDAEVAAKKAQHAVEQETAQRIKAEKNAKIALKQLQFAFHALADASDIANQWKYDPFGGPATRVDPSDSIGRNQNSTEGAIGSLNEVIEQFRNETEVDAETELAIFGLAEVLVRMAPRLNEAQQKSALQAADELSQKSIAIRRSIVAESETVESRSNLASVLENSAKLHLFTFTVKKDPTAAATATNLLKEAVPLRRENCESDFDESRVHELSGSLVLLSTASAYEESRQTEAYEIQKECRDVCRRFLNEHTSSIIASDYLNASSSLTKSLIAAKKWNEALQESMNQFETLIEGKEPGQLELQAMRQLEQQLAAARGDVQESSTLETLLAWTLLELKISRLGLRPLQNNFQPGTCVNVYQSVGSVNATQIGIETVKAFFEDERKVWNKELSRADLTPQVRYHVGSCRASVHHELGSAYYARNLFQEAIAEFRDECSDRQTLADEVGQVFENDRYSLTYALENQSTAIEMLGYALLGDKQVHDAVAEFQRSIDLTRKWLDGDTSAADQNHSRAVHNHVQGVANICNALSNSGVHTESVALLESVIAWGNIAVEKSPSDYARNALTRCTDDLARAYIQAKDWTKARSAIETEFNAELKAIRETESPQKRIIRVANSLNSRTLGNYLDEGGPPDSVIQILRGLIDELELVLKIEPKLQLDSSNPLIDYFGYEPLNKAIIASGDHELLEKLAVATLEVLNRQNGLPESAKVFMYRDLGRICETREQFEDAIIWYRKGLKAYADSSRSSWRYETTREYLGSNLLHATYKLKGNWTETISACGDIDWTEFYRLADTLVEQKSVAEFDGFVKFWEEQKQHDPEMLVGLVFAYVSAASGLTEQRLPGQKHVDLEGAIRIYRRLLKANRNDLIKRFLIWPNYWRVQVDAFCRDEQSRKIAEPFLRELQQEYDAGNKSFVNPRILLGTVLARSGKRDEAIELFTRGFSEMTSDGIVGPDGYNRFLAATTAIFEILEITESSDPAEHERWCVRAESLFMKWFEDGCVSGFPHSYGTGDYEQEFLELFQRLYDIWKKPERLEQVKLRGQDLKAEAERARSMVQSAIGSDTQPLPDFKEVNTVADRIRIDSTLSEPVRSRILDSVSKAYAHRMVDLLVQREMKCAGWNHRK